MTHLFSKFTLATLGIAFVYIISYWHHFTTFVYSPSLDIWYTKWFLLLPLVVGFVLWHFLSLLEKHPEWHEYRALNSENKQYFYNNSVFACYLLKNSLLIFLSLKTINDGIIASGHASLFAGYGDIVSVCSVLCMSGYYVWYTAQSPRKLSEN